MSLQKHFGYFNHIIYNESSKSGPGPARLAPTPMSRDKSPDQKNHQPSPEVLAFCKMILILKGKLLNHTFFINQNMVELTNDFTVYSATTVPHGTSTLPPTRPVGVDLGSPGPLQYHMEHLPSHSPCRPVDVDLGSSVPLHYHMEHLPSHPPGLWVLT